MDLARERCRTDSTEYDDSLPLLPAGMAIARFYLKLLSNADRQRPIGEHAAADGDLIGAVGSMCLWAQLAS